MHAFRLASLVVLVLSTASLAGCGGGGGGGGSSKPKLEGVWERTQGTLFVADGLEQLRYLDLRDGGQGTIYGLQESTGLRECAGLLYSASREGTLTLDAPDLNDGESQARLLLWERDGDELTITDQDGNATVFTRTDEVPATEACTFATTTVFPLAASFPGYSGNLASDGTYLYYQTSADVLVALDPMTGTTASTLAGSPGFPIAAEANGDLWTMCHCGGDMLRRWTLPSTNVDDVDVEDLLGSGFSIEGAAVSGGRLWVPGYRYDTGTSVLMEIDATGEPDVLVQTHTGPLDGRPVTFVDGERWVLAYGLTPKIARVGTDGRAAETLSLPSSVDYPYGFTSHGGVFYVTVYDDLYQSALVRIEAP